MIKNNSKPLVSMIVLTYNHKCFIQDTLNGVFSQTYENIEYIISDDASPDNTYGAVEQYMTDHPTERKVYLNHNEHNVGLVPHWNYVMNNLVHGEIIVFATGDDISMPSRVKDIVALFESDPTIMCVTGQAIMIDKEGRLLSRQGSQTKAGKYVIDDSYIHSFTFMCGGASHAIRRKVWDTFGDFQPNCPTEDSTLRFRSLLLGAIAVSPNVFIQYRIHDNNLSRPDNMKNLKTDGIVSQYKRDVVIARKNGLITENEENRLNKKIHFYEIYRNVILAKYDKSKIVKGLIKLYQMVLEKLIMCI